jgi:hypothetical protein
MKILSNFVAAEPPGTEDQVKRARNPENVGFQEENINGLQTHRKLRRDR